MEEDESKMQEKRPHLKLNFTTSATNAWLWYQFGCSLTFTHFYLVTSNLLPNFLITVTYSFFNIMSSVIPLHQNGGSGEKNAQVKIMI